MGKSIFFFERSKFIQRIGRLDLENEQKITQKTWLSELFDDCSRNVILVNMVFYLLHIAYLVYEEFIIARWKIPSCKMVRLWILLLVIILQDFNLLNLLRFQMSIFVAMSRKTASKTIWPNKKIKHTQTTNTIALYNYPVGRFWSCWIVSFQKKLKTKKNIHIYPYVFTIIQLQRVRNA